MFIILLQKISLLIFELVKFIVEFTFACCFIRFIFDKNIKNPFDVFLEQCKKLSN